MKPFFLLASLAFCTATHAAPWSLVVVDDKGAPVANADVRVNSPSNDVLRFSTDATGRVVGDLPTFYGGSYLGRVVILAPGRAAAGGALQAGENRAKVGVARSVKGRVVDSEGKPLANIAVQLVSVSRERNEDDEKATLENSVDFYLPFQERAVFAARTDAEGRYEIAGLPARGTAQIAVAEATRVAIPVRLDLTEDTTAPDLKARVAARLRGRILLPDGTPAAKQRIFAYNAKVESLAQGETDADGCYVLGGLETGEAVITVGDDAQKAVAVASKTSINLVAATETVVPDIQMTQGALIEIALRALERVRGGSFYLRKADAPDSKGGIELLAQNGVVRARVAPGNYRLTSNSALSGWIAPRETEGKGLPITAVEGHTTTLELNLSPALRLEGTVRDEAGKPVAGVEIKQHYEGSRAVSDANGQFSLGDLKPGKLTLATDESWRIVAPQEFKVPSGPIEIKVKKNLLVPLQGRVVDDKGAPIEGARVSVGWLVRIAGDDGSYGNGRGRTRTDAQGRYEIKRVPIDAQPTVAVTKAQHRVLGGGAFSVAATIPAINGAAIPNPNATFSATDIVMQPLVRKVSGRVVDATGKPVANAVVGALGGGISEEYGPAPRNIARTDAEGRFTLEELPADEIGFVAGARDGFAEVRSKSTVLPDLVLQPQTKPQRDLEAARELVMDLIEATRGGDYYARASLPFTLAPYDYQAALEAAAAMQPGAKVKAETRRYLLWQQIKTSPQQARELVPQFLAELEKETSDAEFGWFTGALLQFLPQPEKIEVAGESEDDAALRAWVRRSFAASKAKLDKIDIGKQSDLETAYSFASLAALAARLGDVAAPQLAQNAVTIGVRYANAQKEDRGSVDAVAEGLAEGGAALVEAVLPHMPPENRAGALGRAIPVIARRDLAGARRLLETVPSQVKPENSRTLNAEPEWAFGLGAKAVLRRMTKEMPPMRWPSRGA